MAGEQTIANDGGGRSIEENGREIGENHRCNGENRRKIGCAGWSVEDGLGSSGDGGVHRGATPRKWGQAESHWSRTVTLWGRCFVIGEAVRFGVKNFSGQGALRLRGGFRKNF